MMDWKLFVFYASFLILTGVVIAIKTRVDEIE